MIRIIIFLNLFLNLALYSQTPKAREDSLINNIESELNKKGIFDYFTYKIVDESYMYVEEKNGKTGFFENFRTYVFWSSKEGDFVKKIDAKNTYKEIKIEGNEVFDFLNKNLTKIKTEKVKSYQEKRGKQLIGIGSSDDDYILFNFKTNCVLTTKKIIAFDIEKGPSSFPNYNYKFNSNLKLILLKNICKELTDKLESEKLFIN